MDLTVVSFLCMGIALFLVISAVPWILRHNATKNLSQTSKDVHTLLTPTETIVHIARQGKFSGWNDTVVATNNRIIIHQIKWGWWGKAVFEEFAWEDVQDATIDGMFGLANLRLTTTDGRKLVVANLVKAQAHGLLAICNERIKQGEDLGKERGDAAKLETLSKKTDSDSPSRAAAGFSQNTRITTPEMQSVYCPNCGAKSDKSANFCRECGQALSDEEQKTHDSQPEHSDKSEETPATLADYMSARIQQMEGGGKDAPSPPLSSNVQEPEKHGPDIEHRDRRSSFSRTETNGESRESSKSSGEVTTKQAAGCVIAIIAGIILWLGFSAILDITGWEPSKDCFGSRGEHIFEDKIRSRLSNPDSMQVHMIETEKVEDQPRYAAVAEVSAENAFGGRARIRAVGYLEETEDACIAVIVSMG